MKLKIFVLMMLWALPVVAADVELKMAIAEDEQEEELIYAPEIVPKGARWQETHVLSKIGKNWRVYDDGRDKSRPRAVVEEYLSRYKEFQKKYDADQQQAIVNVNVKNRWFSQDWKNFKPAVAAAVKQGIHPDDISYMKPILYHAVATDENGGGHCDAPFARFLLAHGANSNALVDGFPLLCEATTVPVALALLAHGADAGCKINRGRNILHTISYKTKEAPQLALLYCMAGADPKVANENGYSPLAVIAEDVVSGQVGSWNKVKFKQCLDFAAQLVKIGVPLTTQIKRRHEPPFFPARMPHGPGDDLRAMLQKGRGSVLVGQIVNDLACFRQVVEDAEKEVVATNAEHERGLHNQLVTCTPLPENTLCPLVAAYAKEHLLPKSLLPDLKKLRQEITLFEQQCAAERKKGAEKRCAIS